MKLASGTERLFKGQLQEDLYMINYHDKNVPIGTGSGSRSLRWATHLELDGRMPTTADIQQHLALVDPDGGDEKCLPYHQDT